MNTYISDYTVPARKYNCFDKLYVISEYPENNNIKEVMITGINYGIYESDNKLRYEFIEFPVPVACPNRFKSIVESTDINSNNKILIDNKYYFIADSKENLFKIKYNYIQSKIDELENIKRGLIKN